MVHSAVFEPTRISGEPDPAALASLLAEDNIVQYCLDESIYRPSGFLSEGFMGYLTNGDRPVYSRSISRLLLESY